MAVNERIELEKHVLGYLRNTNTNASIKEARVAIFICKSHKNDNTPAIRTLIQKYMLSRSDALVIFNLTSKVL